VVFIEDLAGATEPQHNTDWRVAAAWTRAISAEEGNRMEGGRAATNALIEGAGVTSGDQEGDWPPMATQCSRDE
jgi:hypothetical protein